LKIFEKQEILKKIAAALSRVIGSTRDYKIKIEKNKFFEKKFGKKFGKNFLDFLKFLFFAKNIFRKFIFCKNFFEPAASENS
jgi:hypothetical protein